MPEKKLRHDALHLCARGEVFSGFMKDYLLLGSRSWDRMLDLRVTTHLGRDIASRHFEHYLLSCEEFPSEIGEAFDRV